MTMMTQTATVSSTMTMMSQEQLQSGENTQLYQAYLNLVPPNRKEVLLFQEWTDKTTGEVVRSWVRMKNRPPTTPLVHEMMRGRLAVSFYMCDPDTGKTNHTALDFDTESGIRNAQKVGFLLRSYGLRPVLESSREGRAHLHLFHDYCDPSGSSQIVEKALQRTGITSGVEIFPARDGKNLSALRAIFSKNVKDNRQYDLLALDTLQPPGSRMDQLRLLCRLRPSSLAELFSALARVSRDLEQKPNSPRFRQQPSRDTIGQRLAPEPNLLEILASYGIEARRAGKVYKARCPFGTHEDKNGSFTVYPETNTYYCWGCKESGTARWFVRKIQGRS